MVATDELSDVWVEVNQPKFKKPPDISERIKEWVDTQQIEDSQLESPKLRERIIVQKSQEGTVRMGSGMSIDLLRMALVRT
jgi:hypothetical protein